MDEGSYKCLCSNLLKMTQKEKVYCIHHVPNATISETTVGEERCRHWTHLGWLGVLSQFQNSGKSQKSHCQGGLYKMAPFPCHLHPIALNSLHPHKRESISNQCPWRQSHTKTAPSPRTCITSSSWNTSLSDPAFNFLLFYRHILYMWAVLQNLWNFSTCINSSL